MYEEDLERVEKEAREWGKEHHPDASPQRHSALINAVTYGIFRFTGRFGGPSVREHVATAMLQKSGVNWESRPREELYRFLDPLIYGPIQELHRQTWIMMQDICFDDDPNDINELAATRSVAAKDGKYESTRIWPQSLRKLRIIAAAQDESIVETIDRLANQEMARLRLERRRQVTEE